MLSYDSSCLCAGIVSYGAGGNSAEYLGAGFGDFDFGWFVLFCRCCLESYIREGFLLRWLGRKKSLVGFEGMIFRYYLLPKLKIGLGV